MESTKADLIATALEEAIAVGSIPPGAILRQDQISREFGVSRTPVREALRRLAALGLASFEPNRGVRVMALDRRQWREAYLARAALERLAAELAAPRITEGELERLAVSEAEFARCTDSLRSDLDGGRRQEVAYEWLQANLRFHDVILAASGSELVQRLVRTVRRAFSGRAVWRPESELDRLYVGMVRQHAAIREALAARSARGAGALSAEHVMDSWRLLEAILDEGPPARAGDDSGHR